MKTGFLLVVFLVSVSQLGCSPTLRVNEESSSSSTTSGKSAAEISAAINAKYEGVYQMGCDASSDPINDEWVVTSDGNSVYNARDYDAADTTCASQPISIVQYVYKNTFSESGTTNIHKVDLDIVKVTIVSLKPSRTSDLQSGLDSACPSNGVTLYTGIPADLTGKCAEILLPKYSLMGLNEVGTKSIQLGKYDGTYDGSTAEKRPVELNGSPAALVAADDAQKYRGIFKGIVGGESCINVGGAYMAIDFMQVGDLSFQSFRYYTSSNCTTGALAYNSTYFTMAVGTQGAHPAGTTRIDLTGIDAYRISFDNSVTTDWNNNVCGGNPVLTTGVSVKTTGLCEKDISSGEQTFGLLTNDRTGFNGDDNTADPSLDGTTALKRPEAIDTSFMFMPY